ncbi:Synaptotagmin-like protein 4 [Taenia crassiceps]|uniref:Synaptotagmin-like protein 4 n=1 Tax=Taenia crassiceps TaxID=6207 RepID=A0ABR4Q924_9CEST
MSVVSSKYAGKPASVISSFQGGTSVAGRNIAGKQVTNSSMNSSKPVPFNAVTIPNSAGKGRVLGDQEITEEEMEHLANVCRRYDMLQRQEDERIKNIREKAISKEKARRGITRYDEAHCALCGSAFMVLFNPKSMCQQCDLYVCRNCVQKRLCSEGVICKICFSECSNKARTGLWFTEKLQVAKKDGRVIAVAPTSALRASLIRKRREQSAASSVVGKPQPTPQGQNGSVSDPVKEAARRLAQENERYNSLGSNTSQRPPRPLSPSTGAEQLAFNVIFSGVEDMPKTLPRTNSRRRSSSGYATPNTFTGYSDANNWDNRSMVSGVSVGSVTSVYSEREESFTHGIAITGELSFSIDYDDKSSSLRIFVKQAREVAVADKKTNNSSTYVKTYLLPDKTKQSKRKTKVKKNTINPVFNEALVYTISKSDLAYRTLQISLWHHRHMKANLFLGEVLVPLADYRFSSTQIWRALQSRSALEGTFDYRLTKGQIRLGLKFLPATQGDLGELHVYIKNATDLNVPVGASGESDQKNLNPVVKTYLLPDRPKDSKRKTKVVKKTNNPTWEETLVYKGIAKTQLPSIGVEIVVWDANKLNQYDYLGGCNLNTGSRSGFGMDATGTERALWVEMMSKPNTMVEGSLDMVDVAEDLIETTDRDEKKYDIIDGVCIRHEKLVVRAAKRILDIVIKRFKTIDDFVKASYGPMISVEKATEKVMNYIKTASFPTPLEVIWCDDLIGSALMVSSRSALPYQASDRHFTVLLRSNSGNTYLREQGILSLLDHELGTHYLRSYNDGTQVWYMKRKEFELTSSNSRELMTIEEGLACLHTAFHGRYPYLGIPALLYYGACMAEYLPFKDLYQHLSKYVKSEDQLWKHCMRVKRCLPCQNDCGGYGKDQRYFEGAIAILRDQNNIDFAQLMCGKLAISDLPRIKDVCSAERIHLPYFMKPMAAYRKRLLQIARLNGVTVMRMNSVPTSLGFDKTVKTSHTGSASRSFQDSKNTRPAKRYSSAKLPPREHTGEVRNLADRRDRSASLKGKHPVNSRLAASQPALETSLTSESPYIEVFPTSTSYLEGLNYVDVTPVSATQRESLHEQLNTFKNLVFVAVDALQVVVRCFLAVASSRGGIAEVEKRKPVAWILYLHFFLIACEFVAYSLVIYFEASSQKCLSKACFFLRNACVLGLVLLVVSLIFILTTFDSTGRVWRHHPGLWCMEEGANSRRLNRAQAHRLIARLWRRRIRCLACLRNACRRLDLDTKRSSQDAMLLVSDMVGTYFMTNLVASDLLAGLLLLRWQSHQWIGCESRVPLQRVLEDSDVYDPVTDPPPHAGSVGVLVPRDDGNPFNRLATDWLSIRRLWVYSKYASAVYGRLLYLFSQRLSPRAALRLCKYATWDGGLGPCCPQTGGDAETHPFLSPSDETSMGCCICKHDTCNLAVYQEITGAPIESLVYYSFVNNVYQSPFFVAFDDESESIIIAIRGTLSPEDVIVDMLAEGKRPLLDELPSDVPAEQISDFYVHMGILYTARNLRDIIIRLQLVEKARIKRPCYPLVVCGHSLGAGVASVLAFLLRKCYPEVKAYAYSPPLGLMSARMARYCKPFVVSIVLGCDIVPRLSIPTLNDLKWRLLSALQDCNVPKYRILANAVRIVGLNCLFPSFCRPTSTTIGLDTRLFTASCQYNLLRPKVFSPRGAPTISSSTEYSDFVAESTASLHRPVRYLSENRSLFRWLRAKTDVLLRTDASGTIYVPFVSALRSSEFSTITASGSVEVNGPTGAHSDFVSMDTSVRFAGLIVHLVQVEDTELRTSTSLRSDSSAPSPWYQDQLAPPPVAIWSNSRQFQTIIIHPRMLSDHLPDEVSTALYRLYTATCQSDSPLLSGNAGPLDPRALVRRLKKPVH